MLSLGTPAAGPEETPARADTNIEITMLDVNAAAVRLAFGKKVVYIDAPIGVSSTQVADATVMFSTHDDLDHFDPRASAAAARASRAPVIGPPTISYPLLVDEKLSPELVIPLYSPLAQKNDKGWHTQNGIRFRIFRSSHVSGWGAIHLSFLIELGGRRFFHTGDSLDPLPKEATERDLDALFCNTKLGNEKSLELFLELLKNPKILRIIPYHFHGTNDVLFAELAKQRGEPRIVVLGENNPRLVLPASASAE